MRRLLYLLVPFVLVATACGGGDNPAVSAEAPASSSSSETPMGTNHGHGGNGTVAERARTVEVAAGAFSFDPPRIEAEAGEDIAIELTAVDSDHDFVIDELDSHVVAAAMGATERGGFTAPESGTYQYYCSVAGHRDGGMEGTLVVS